MPFQTDIDWKYLDRVIALSGKMLDAINRVSDRPDECGIKEITDDPDVLHRLLEIESAALVIRKTSRDYRERLRQLKALEIERPAGSNGRPKQQKQLAKQ
jgi:hypothetical protein